MMRKILLCGAKGWAENVYLNLVTWPAQDAVFYYLNRPEELERIAEALRPEYIFFLHWHWKVPEKLVQEYACVGFHAAPLPRGRGGSPIQNQILEGITETALSVFRMNDVMDGGPIYSRCPFSLEGSLEEILDRIAERATAAISWILQACPEASIPNPDEEATYYQRRTTTVCHLEGAETLQAVLDRIRMLDAPGQYPPAHIRVGKWKLEFSGAVLHKDCVEAQICIREC